VRLLREEIAPLLNSANETARNCSGHDDFISDTVVKSYHQSEELHAGVWQAARNAVYCLAKRSNPKPHILSSLIV
jgi:hypothetical protein